MSRFRRFFGIAVLAGTCLLLGSAASAQAATQALFAAPAAVGAGDCSSIASACSIATAVTIANAAPVTDSVQIKLADGTYQLSTPSPTALAITFAGPSLTLEAEGGAPTLSGTNTVRVLSIAAASNVTIDGLAIELGSTSGLGGGIENSGKLTVENATFVANKASNGGAISNTAGATLAVTDSSFVGNTTTSVGGGAIIDSGTAAIERSAIIGNKAPINGGGVNVQPGGAMTVANSTISNNTSGSAGGAFANLGTLNVEASTIANNSGSDGAAIATAGVNGTFAANIIGTQASGKACSPANAAFVDGGYNLDVDGTCISTTTPAEGSHNGQLPYGPSTYGAVLDAYLADAPADNGGQTQTIALLSSPNPPTAGDDPALGVVPASFKLPVPIGGVPTACALSDQRGLPRRIPCDIGAFEVQPPPPPAPAAPAKVTPPPPAPKPGLTGLSLAPKKLRNGQKATISFKLDIGAQVTFQLKRKVRKHGKVKLVGSGGAPKSFTAPAGTVKRSWTPHGLPVGKYQLSATPAGGTTTTFNFKIVPKRH
jgi:hypothetical protein